MKRLNELSTDLRREHEWKNDWDVINRIEIA